MSKIGLGYTNPPFRNKKVEGLILAQDERWRRA